MESVSSRTLDDFPCRQCSVTPGCRGQIGVLRAKGKTADHLSHRSAYGGSDTYLFIFDGKNLMVWVFDLKKFIGERQYK